MIEEEGTSSAPSEPGSDDCSAPSETDEPQLPEPLPTIAEDESDACFSDSASEASVPDLDRKSAPDLDALPVLAGRASMRSEIETMRIEIPEDDDDDDDGIEVIEEGDDEGSWSSPVPSASPVPSDPEAPAPPTGPLPALTEESELETGQPAEATTEGAPEGTPEGAPAEATTEEAPAGAPHL